MTEHKEVLTLEEEKEAAAKAAEEEKLNKPITFKFLLSFTIPTILSFIIMGIFGTIDGVFAARGINQEALGAINFVMPFFTFTMAIGAMLSIGGTALIAKKKGKKLLQEARENFTLLTLVTFVTSMIISVVGWFARSPLLRLLGTDSDVFDLALEYIQPLILMMPFIMVGMFLVQLMIAEGRPVLSMFASSSGALVSTSLNALFIFVFDLGVMGLALATGIGYAVPTILGMIYFTFSRKKGIYFVRPKWDIRALGRSSMNGISEMVTMLATTVTTIVMNNVLVRIVGWEGVAAAGIALAGMGILSSLFFGYASGIAPVVSYNFGKKKHYGADSEIGQERHGNLKKLYKKSLIIVAALSVIALVGTLIFADLMVRIYVSPNDVCVHLNGLVQSVCSAHLPVYEYMSGYGAVPMEYLTAWGGEMCTGHLHAMSVRGLRIISFGFLLMGFNVFATAWFTAFNDGLVSGFMSLMRTMVFTLTLLVTLPRIITPSLDGAWLAMPLAEVLAIVVTIFFLRKMGKKYYYREG
ncbi:MAG: MATE family efflux transporter [Oscillospiraceae bacterium]|nr:MATE family efflux transporter [Oscillospiraceae bacterium]